MKIKRSFACRQFSIIIVNLSINFFTNNSTLKELSCESYTTSEWVKAGEQATCYIKSTAIASDGIKFSPESDESVLALNFYQNEKVLFLPIGVDEKFPNLEDYDASFCSITAIKKKNFEKLKNLKRLYLGNNQIEKVRSDTFQDLISLEILHLSKKK